MLAFQHIHERSTPAARSLRKHRAHTASRRDTDTAQMALVKLLGETLKTKDGVASTAEAACSAPLVPTAMTTGGGPRSGVAWRYSGLRPEAAFEAGAPRAAAKAGAAKPKRQSRQHEKATKSKVKYGSRR